jgi:diguanylate cyclase (GGDEF)-like protein
MLQNMHNQLTHQATHDDLTGLLNRKEFEREIDKALENAKRNDLMHLCAYMDLDQFKVINNTGGHDAGDKLLVNIAQLLKEQLEYQDAQISRLGGDEFGILVKDCDREKGMDLMKSISEAVKHFRFEWEKDTFSLTTSCGLYYIEQGTESVSKILTGADAACFAAKEAGRDRIHDYSDHDSEMEHRKDIMEFVSQIDRALENDRFALNVQKIQPIDEENSDVHYEILLTVLDEDDNPLPPQDFIIAAETYNRMGAVDRWVIKNAFDFISSNILKLEDLGAFSINISGNSLTEDDFMEFVLEQFNRTRLPTSKVCFEITETSAIGSLDDVVEFMEKMKIIGVQFSLDDFGTGLSSYSYLRNLPVDFLKIDGIFVKDIKENPSDYAVVKSINEIGHFMGKKTIAEFVEDNEILEILREIGVDYAQGYGVGRKIPIGDLL